MQLLFEVEDVFDISGRGCVLVPGVPYDFAVPVRPGSRILLETPEGNRIETSIKGFEMINRGKPMQHAPFSIPRNVAKSQVPKGTRVYLCESDK